MFGQQPQQQYGYQPQQRQPAQLSSLGDLLAGNSAKAYFGANSQPGDTVTGVIEKIETTQVNDFQTKQPAFWNDGRPKEQIHVIIQTQLRDPSGDAARYGLKAGASSSRRFAMPAVRRA